MEKCKYSGKVIDRYVEGIYRNRVHNVINYNKEEKQVDELKYVETKPKKEEISPFASEIRQLVEKLATIEAYQYGGEGKARKKWYGAIKKRYGLDKKEQTYKDLDEEQAKNCISYLKSMLPIKTRTLKNSDEVYRKERYTAIYARARELGMSKGDVYVLFSNLFGKNIISLTKATNDEIEELYNYLMKRR